MNEPTEAELISKAMSVIARRPRPNGKKYFSEADKREGAARRVREFRDRKKKEKEDASSIK